MTLEDKQRAAAIAAIRERAGLRWGQQERGRCLGCRRPVPFGVRLCLRCELTRRRPVW